MVCDSASSEWGSIQTLQPCFRLELTGHLDRSVVRCACVHMFMFVFVCLIVAYTYVWMLYLWGYFKVAVTFIILYKILNTEVTLLACVLCSCNSDL